MVRSARLVATVEVCSVLPATTPHRPPAGSQLRRQSTTSLLDAFVSRSPIFVGASLRGRPFVIRSRAHRKRGRPRRDAPTNYEHSRVSTRLFESEGQKGAGS